MRAILTALILGISVAAVGSPALAADQEREDGRVLATSDQDTVQISVGAVAGSDEQAPAMQERFEKN